MKLLGIESTLKYLGGSLFTASEIELFSFSTSSMQPKTCITFSSIIVRQEVRKPNFEIEVTLLVLEVLKSLSRIIYEEIKIY